MQRMHSRTDAGRVRVMSAHGTLERVVRLPRLRYFRERRALSQRDLAKLADVTDRTIRRLESGETDSRPSTTRKLARALKVKPDELMDPEPTD